ncbi:MAG TPA: baseplate J/gp47 family protein [Chloroflexota bacterium]|nr:baseplate J/gp47 family protein [Chloroflexota bacterium]
MKQDHILLLDEGESIGSVLNRVDASTTQRIAIVAGERSPLHNPVSIRLLQRRARDRALQLAVISDDEFTRRLCRETGLPAYSTLEAFKDGMWSPSNRVAAALRSMPLDSWFSRVFGGILLLVLLAVLYLVLPAATITVAPASRPFPLDVPLVADAQQQEVDAAAGRIPARVLSLDVSGQQTVQATGQRSAPDQTASGSVTLTNTAATTVTIPKGTLVVAGAEQFQTMVEAVVPGAAHVGSNTLPGTSTLPVQAMQPGTEGNVPAGAVNAIAGSLAGSLGVVNTQPISGGTDKQVGMLSQQDQTQAKEALRQQLTQQGLQQIRSQLARNLTFLPDPSVQTDTAIEQLSFDQTPEQVTNATVLHMKVLVRGLTFVGDDVNAAVNQAVASAVQHSGRGIALTRAPVTIDPPVVQSDDGSTIKLSVHASAQVSSPIDATKLSNAVRGMTVSQASTYLRNVPGVGNAQVKLWPLWVSHVSRFAWRIQVHELNPVQVQGS